ncbi:Pre-rRNA-processing protein esf2-like [Oopsacas minuta]|uniref:Activator of basal transcription 1 n=1 Tax=Oopsacas minuta TaxID=111878 RepID=A0AAV7JMH7_9METZ|nr:Pre-rRNA-processing protein esf2-like [Oopsacas minuta]
MSWLSSYSSDSEAKDISNEQESTKLSTCNIVRNPDLNTGEPVFPPYTFTQVIKHNTRASITKKKKQSPGVVYLSRIPPYMCVNKVRHLLSQFGEVGRIYLQKEDPMVRRRRKLHTRKKKMNFIEGWVELKEKIIAKQIAESLNITQIGGKKRNFHYSDLWTVKYLKGFKWFHLTESIAYQSAVRDRQLRTEISQVKRETMFYMQNVEKGRELTAIQERKIKHNKELNDGPWREHLQREVQTEVNKCQEDRSMNISFLTKILPNSIA